MTGHEVIQRTLEKWLVVELLIENCHVPISSYKIVDIITNTIFSSSGRDRILDVARMYFLEVSAYYEYSLWIVIDYFIFE